MKFGTMVRRFSRVAITENRSKPDFLFPSVTDYHDLSFPVDRLTMLGAKSTCKDRWRQVLAEASRIPRKHLFTLETAISTFQTEEMAASNLQLVLPKSLHSTYTEAQRQALLDLESFISLVRGRQGVAN